MLKNAFVILSLGLILVTPNLNPKVNVAQAATTSEIEASTIGYILLQVESHGEAWYVDPVSGLRYYLPDGIAAYEMMEAFGLGISEADYALVAEGNPTLIESLRGRIILRVEENGEAYYMHPDGNVYYMADGDDAYTIMRQHSLGITNRDLEFIAEATENAIPYPTEEETSIPSPEPAPVPAPEPTPVPDEPEVFNHTLYVGPAQIYKTIDGALNHAVDGDLILVEPGTYTDRLLVYEDITIRSTGGAASTIIAEGAQLSVLKTWGNLTLDGFTVTTTSDVARHCIRVAPYASIILKNSIVTECTAGDGLGGGLRLDTDTWGIVQDTVFIDNYAIDPRGARAAHLYSRGDSLLIQRSQFINGVADNDSLGDGGAMFVNSGTVTIEDSTFSNNAAGDDGGAIGLEGLGQVNQDGTVSDGVSLLVLRNNVFSNNSADNHGGAIFARDVAVVDIADNVFCENTVVDGDGPDMYFERVGGTVIGNTLSGDVYIKDIGPLVSGNTISTSCL